MEFEEAAFFCNSPEALPLYEAVREIICACGSGISISVKKTQIGFSTKRGFAWVWFPGHKPQTKKSVSIMISFGLGYPVTDGRIQHVVQPYPGRFMHHMPLTDVYQADEQLQEWLREAYDFSARM